MLCPLAPELLRYLHAFGVRRLFLVRRKARVRVEPGNKLTHPWLAAVWPGMGHVALNAGVYLLSKLGMTQVAEVETGDLFDVEAVEVEGPVLIPARRQGEAGLPDPSSCKWPPGGTSTQRTYRGGIGSGG
jgi:hypothetical protein